MQYTIFHRGIPIAVAIPETDRPPSNTELLALPAFEALRPLYLRRQAVLGSLPPGGIRERRAALEREDRLAMELELRDLAGRVMATGAIKIQVHAPRAITAQIFAPFTASSSVGARQSGPQRADPAHDDEQGAVEDHKAH